MATEQHSSELTGVHQLYTGIIRRLVHGEPTAIPLRAFLDEEECARLDAGGDGAKGLVKTALNRQRDWQNQREGGV